MQTPSSVPILVKPFSIKDLLNALKHAPAPKSGAAPRAGIQAVPAESALARQRNITRLVNSGS